MFLGLALVLGALLWAHGIRRDPRKTEQGFRGPWIMGTVGACVFLFYLWLITHRAFDA